MACGEPEGAGDVQVSCRLNSDCGVGQTCLEEVCVAAEPCEGENCPCFVDSDCGINRACDLDEGLCFDIVCTVDGQCGLGEVCLRGLCETDVDADRDRDGVPDTEDLCPDDQNADQEDNDFDGLGDVCDEDDDNDTIPDTIDNCVFDPNNDQFDHDGDGVGNPCDPDFQGLDVIGLLTSPLENVAFNDIATVTIVGASRVSAIVQPSGAFEIRGLLPGLYALEIEADGHFPTNRVLRLEEDDLDLGDIALILQNQLDEGESLSGQVVLSDGAEPLDVIVRARINDVLVDTTLTDAQGTFAFDAAPLNYTIELDKPGYQRTSFEVLWIDERDRFEINNTPVAEFDGFILSPDLSASVSGQLTSTLENLVFNDIATVTLVGRDSQHLGVVGPEGDFQIGPVRPGLYGLQIETAGHLPASRIVSLIAGDNDLGELALVPEFEAPEQAAQMQGRATLSDGETPSGIIVRGRIGGVLVTTTLSDEAGAWAMLTARLDHSLEFEKPGYQRTTLDVVWSEDRERFEVNSEALSQFEGVVLSPDLSASLSGRLTSSLENVTWNDIASISLVGERRHLAVVEPDGDFQIGPVRPGLYGLEIEANGHLPTSRVVNLGSGLTELGVIELITEFERPDRAVEMAGVVSLSDGGLPSDIAVRARLNDRLVNTTLTDSQGHFTMQTSRVDYSVEFSKPGYQPLVVTIGWSVERERFEIDGEPLSTFEGLALAPDLSALVSGRLTSSLENIVWNDIASVALVGERRHLAVVEPDGDFQIGPLRPGVYGLEIEAEGHISVGRIVSIVSGSNDLDTIVLVTEFERPDRAVSLAGSASLSDGATPSGIIVRARLNDVLIDTTLTDRDGAFILQAARLDYSLEFEKPGYQTRAFNVVWSEVRERFEINGEPLEDFEGLTLSPDLSATATGQLTSTLENLVFNDIATVRLIGEQVHVATIEGDGLFQVGPVRPGLYGLEVTAQGHLPVSRVITLASGDNDLGDIDLIPEFEAPEEAATLRATASLTDGAAPSGIIVRARIGGVLVATTLTDDLGVFVLQAARLDHSLEVSKPGYQTRTFNVVWSEVRERFEINGEALEDFEGMVLSPDLSATATGRLTSTLENLVFNDIATVTLVGNGRHTAIVTPEGDFQVVAVQPGIFSLQVEAAGHLPVSRAVTLTGGDNDLGDIALTPEFEAPEEAATLAGAVSLGDGAGPGDTVVRARIGGVLVATTLTDDLGAFVLQTARLDHSLEFSKPGYLDRSFNVLWSEVRERFEVSGEATDTFEGFVLAPDLSALGVGRLTSTLENLTFNAIATVTFVGERTHVATIEPDGDFQADSMRPGIYGLQIEANGHLPVSRVVSLASGVNDLGDIALTPEFEGPLEAVALRGTATLSDGAEPENIAVRARINDVLIEVTLTDAAGNFSFQAARLDYSLEFSKPGYQTRTFNVVWSEVRERFEINGEPLEDFDQIVLSADLSATATGTLTSTLENLVFNDIATVRLIGEQVHVATIEGGGGFQVGPVRPGLYGLEVTAQGHLPVSRVITLASGDNDLGDIDLIPEVEVPEQAVALSARVSLGGEQTHGDVVVRGRINNVLVATTLTDDQGSFTFQTSRFDHALSFDAVGFVPRTINVVWADARDRFEFNDQALSTQTFALSPEPANGILSVVLDVQPGWIPLAQRHATVGVQGDAFVETRQQVAHTGEGAPERFVSVPSGSYIIEATRSGFTSAQRLLTIDRDVNQAEGTLSIQLQDLAAARLDLEGVVLDRAIIQAAIAAGVDFRGADLSGVRLTGNLSGLGLNLSGADLSGADLSGTNLTGVDLSGANFFAADLTGVALEDADMSGANLSSANLTGARFVGLLELPRERPCTFDPDDIGVNLTGAIFSQTNLTNAVLNGVVLEGADLSGAVLRGANLGSACLTGINLTLTDLSEANFNLADLTNARFINAILDQTTLKGAKMIRANFSSAIIERADFGCLNRTCSTMSQANLTGANLAGASFAGANLTGASMLGVIMGSVDQTRTSFASADLTGAQAIGVIFNGVDLSGATLAGASLRNAIFAGTLFTGASFSQADLTQASLTGEALRGIDLADATLRSAVFDTADLAGADLTGADLTNASGEQADFTDADLTGANLSRTALTDANLTGVIAPSVPFNAAELSDAIFDNAALNGADFTDITASRVSFQSANLTGANLNGARLISADLTGADLTDITAVLAVLTNAALLDASLVGASLPLSNLADADLSGADLSNTDLSNTDLSGSNLSTALLDATDFVGSDLLQADFTDATLDAVTAHDLGGCPTNLPTPWLCVSNTNNRRALVAPGAVLSGADLSGVDLVGVDLTGADLTGANLTGANLTGADLDLARVHDLSDCPATLPSQSYSCVVNHKQRFAIVGPGVDLRNADLIGADLKDVQMGSALLDGLAAHNLVGNSDNLDCPQSLPSTWECLEAGDGLALVGPNANLKNANLRGIDLNLNFGGPISIQNADFSGADLTSADTINADFSGANMAATRLDGITSGFMPGDCPINLPFPWRCLTNTSGRHALVGPGMTLDGDISGMDFANTIIDDLKMSATSSTCPLNLPSPWRCVTGNNARISLVGPGATLSGNLSGADFSRTTLDRVRARITGCPINLPSPWRCVSTSNDGFILVGPNASLEAIDFRGASFSGADLSGAVFDRSDLSGVSFSGTTLTGLHAAELVGNCPNNLPSPWRCITIDDRHHLLGPNADLSGARISNGNLTGANLTGANLEGLVAQNLLGSCPTLPAPWRCVTHPNGRLMLAGPNANLQNAVVTNSNFSGTSIDGLISSNLTGCPINLPSPWQCVTDAIVGPDAVITGSNLDGADFTGTTIDGIEAHGLDGACPVNLPTGWVCVTNLAQKRALAGPGASLADADLRFVDLSAIDLQNATLKGADLEGALLTGADLSLSDLTRADLFGANLTDADLFGATLFGAHLQGANLTGTDLEDADIQHANLQDTDLTGANLTDADLTGAIFNDNTTCPDGRPQSEFPLCGF